MSPKRNMMARDSPWSAMIKFFLVVALVVVIFLVGKDMVRHRFFRGGRMNQHDVLQHDIASKEDIRIVN